MYCLTVLLLAVTARWLPVQGYTYMAVVPSNARPNSELVIPIKFNMKVQGETVSAKMFDRNTNNVVIAETTQIINGKSEGTMVLQVPSTISWGNYRVNITGTGPIPFKNTTLVYGNTKSLSIFVQTDKAIYKPADKVKYRVFVVNGSLSSIDTLLNIEFFDPSGNKIDERMNVSSMGSQQHISGELSLADLPPLGSWSIKVVAPGFGENAEETYRFDVQEYVLPKFEVTVTMPPYGLTTSPTLTGTVKAEYVFGKPVQGTVILDIKRRYGTSFYQVAAARTSLAINGEATFSVPKIVLEQLSQNLEYATIHIEAAVTETITGITQKGKGEVRYHSQPYQIEWYPNMPDNFKPGFNTYTVWLKVSMKDGTPPDTLTKKVKIGISYFLDTAMTQTIANNLTIPDYDMISPFIPGQTVLLNTIEKLPKADGTVKFTIDIPSTVATASIKAEFNGEKIEKQLSRFRSPGEHYLKIKIVNVAPLRIEDFANVEVSNSIKNATTAYYIVKSKGLIVDSGRLNLGNTGTGSLQLKITREMAPSGRLVVYYVSITGEIIADGINFIIEDIFQNKMTIAFDKTTEVEPRTNVSLEVTADHNSLVAVLVVDQSVKLLKEGNDITKERVSDELRRYGDSPWIRMSSSWGRTLPWSFTADDASDIFSNARLTVLSDGLLPNFNLWSLRQRAETGSKRAFSTDMAMSASPMGGNGGGPNAPTGMVRKEFPETWIWKTAIAKNGKAVFPDVAPDTMTKFVASAFALSDSSGLGVVDTPALLQVALPFFLVLRLPYGLVRNEIAVIQANVFNSHNESLYVNVTLSGSNDFVGITIDANQNEVEVNGSIMKCVLVKPGTPTAVFFNVKPTVIGNLKLRVRASVTITRNIFDEVVKDIPVKAEGEEKEDNIPVLISEKSIAPSSVLFNFSWPITASPDLVPGSERARFTLIGDVFGPSLKNLDKLIRLPYGCGEQNMLNFAPSVFAAVYMKITGRFESNAELQLKIVNSLRTGYQRQLIYQRHDGSFSTFGNADKEGSLWLTAFVVKSFSQANKLNLIFIDPKVVDRAVKYILDNQAPDGTFLNTGIVNHKAMQGATGSSTRVLTTYILIVLLEVQDSGFLEGLSLIRLSNSINSAVTYLSSKVSLMTSDYERAIGAYAFIFARKAVDSKTLMTALENSPNKVATVPAKKTYWKNRSHSMELEIASYALMTYTKTQSDPKARDNGMEILMWLIGNRGPFGGYASTQDTVVAVQATSEFAALIFSKVVDMNIDIITETNRVFQPKLSFTLNPQNQDILQFKDTDKFDTVEITATGKGLAMLDINIFYNVLKEAGQPSYILTLKTTKESKNSYVLTVCSKYNIPNSKSNMAMLDVGAISGFEPVEDLIIKTPLMKRIETSTGRIVFYFDEIPSTEVCVDVTMQRISLVSNVQPATVLAYSYYEPSERKMNSYIPNRFKSATLCSICGTECGCGPSSTELLMAQCGTVY